MIKKSVPIILIIVNVFGCAHWDRTDKVLFGALVAGAAADVITTDRVLDDGGEEKNPILKGNTELILPLNILGIGVIYLIADCLSPKSRKWLLGIANGVKWGCAAHNYNEMNK